jgi:hypothetical protein
MGDIGQGFLESVPIIGGILQLDQKGPQIPDIPEAPPPAAAPKLPAAPPPTETPAPESAAAEREARKAALLQRERAKGKTGRSSTILAPLGQTLAPGNVSQTTLLGR